MKIKDLIIIAVSLLLCCQCNLPARQQATSYPPSNLLDSLLSKDPAAFTPLLNKKDSLRLQIIYTRIDRKPDGSPVFTDYFFNRNDNLYFYPASTVKLPVAILALQRIRELNIPGLNRETTFFTGEDGDGQTPVIIDSSATDLRPTIGQYIRKILLVSDNDAFNRLYEFLGQDYINRNLQRMGYPSSQIVHRLAINMSEKQNRHTNPCRFVDVNGKTLYEQTSKISDWGYQQRMTKIGKGYMRGDSLVKEPLDFSTKNRLLLYDLHRIVRSIMFPEAVPAVQRFGLKEEDYQFLRQFMSMTPRESSSPVYDTSVYYDNWVKFLYYGAGKTPPRGGLRIFNKVGDAYGFLIDAAYFADFSNQIEFQLSAVIYCNADGILNDDKYDYESVGFPFMQQLGQLIYQYELTRKPAIIPDLSTFRIMDK